MFSFSLGRRNSGNDQRSGNYALVPVSRTNPSSSDTDSERVHRNVDDEFNGGNEVGENRINNSEIELGVQGDGAVGESQPQRRTFTIANMEQEQIRRQQILRLGLIACLVLFLMDGSSYSNVSPDSRNGGNSSKKLESLDEIRFGSVDLADAKTVLLPIRPSTFVKRNVTGIFKGPWQTYSTKPTSRYPDNDYRSYFNSPNTTISFEEGSLILTLKTIPIHDLPDLSFVYGLARTYDNKLKLLNHLSFPLQGVLLTAEKKLLMFSTPYKTQKLMLQYSNQPTISDEPPSQPPISSAIDELTEDTESLHTSSKEFTSGQYQLNQILDVAAETHSYELVPTESEGLTFRIKPNLKGTKSVPSNQNTMPPQLVTESNNLGLNIFVWDSAIAKFNSSQWSNNFTRTMIFGDSQLSARFKYFQMSRPTMSFPAPSLISGHSSSLFGRSSVQDAGDQASPSSNHIQTPASLASDYFYALDFNLDDHGLDINQVSHLTEQESTMTQFRSRALKVDDSVDSHKETELQDTSDESNSHSNHHRLLTSIIPSTENLHGAVKGFFSNSKTFILSISSYQLEYDSLKNKVEVYSLLYTAVCLMQVVFVIFQIRYSSTQALASRMSILGVLSQSVLDAVICMGHLLLGTGVSDLFFGSFIWVSVLKLLLFSVFQMRLVINAYQARFAQEISIEGLRGLRARLVTMHIRFYGVVLFILIVGFSFPIHPMIIVLCLYSFWIPQIVHNLQHGTKHAFHPVYFFGMTVSRLFLPLYIMGCPENFLVGLWEYFSPSGHLASNSMILSSSACYFLVIWLAFQVIVLHLQNVFGARFFVPKRFLPQRYDYRRPLPASIQSNLSTTATGSSNGDSIPEDTDLETGALLRPNTSSNNRSSGDVEMSTLSNVAIAIAPSSTLECVICYNAIEVQGYNHNYMITPCDHVFHEECLQQWLRVKLECPVCRARCPPAEELDNEGDSGN